MNAQPSIFIGSSAESVEYANALQRVLDRDLVTTVWNYGVFLPGSSTLYALLEHARKTDFAALFLTPDDKAVVRAEYLKTPRDNLIFELGLFIGHIGPERAFLITPREEVSLPTDLQGITPITYRTDRPDNDAQNAVNPAATDIRSAVKQVGRRRRKDASGVPVIGSPLPDVLVAIGHLGAVVDRLGASLEMRHAVGGRFELLVVDDTRLGTSVEIDLADVAAVRAIGHLRNNLLTQ